MNRPEQKLQIELMTALMGPLNKVTGERLRSMGLLPRPWFAAHIPNGGQRGKVEAGIFKAMGVMPGMPDLLLIGPNPNPAYGVLSVIGLELKAPPAMLQSGKPSRAKPRVSDAQRDAIEALSQVGIPVFVVQSIDEALDVLRKQGVPLKGRAM